MQYSELYQNLAEVFSRYSQKYSSGERMGKEDDEGVRALLEEGLKLCQGVSVYFSKVEAGSLENPEREVSEAEKKLNRLSEIELKLSSISGLETLVKEILGLKITATPQVALSRTLLNISEKLIGMN